MTATERLVPAIAPRNDPRYTTSRDARAVMRAWAGNGSIDLGAWTGESHTMWDFYFCVDDMLKNFFHVHDEIAFTIALVEDDPEGNRAPYSSDGSILIQKRPMRDWRPI